MNEMDLAIEKKQERDKTRELLVNFMVALDRELLIDKFYQSDAEIRKIIDDFLDKEGY